MPKPVSPRSKRSKSLPWTRAWNYVTGSEPSVPEEPSWNSVKNEPVHSQVTDSTKRRMLVIMTQQQEKGLVPRQQLMSQSYKGVYSQVRNLYESQEAVTNDLEARRRSIFTAYQPLVKESVENEGEIVKSAQIFATNKHNSVTESDTEGLDGFQRFVSPLEGQLELRYSETPDIDVIEAEQEYPESYDYSIYAPLSPSAPQRLQIGENGDNMPIIIEHEFAPLYKDASGNLVRPPFINLDPRERHQLFQLKRLIEAAEQLQKRLKYMKAPQETTSKKIGGNKVETSTQTIDNDYLLGQLNIKKQAVARTKRSANTAGFFSGHFEYDVSPPKKAKFKGYLGKISMPLVDDNTSETLSTPKLPEDIIIDKEYIEKRDDKPAKSISNMETKLEAKSGESIHSEKSDTKSEILGSSKPTLQGENFGNLFSKSGNSKTVAFPDFSKKSDDSSAVKTPTSTTFTIPTSTNAPTFSFEGSKLKEDKNLPSAPQFSLPSKEQKATPFSLTGPSNSAPTSILNTSAKPAFLFDNSTPSSNTKLQLEPKRKRAEDDEPETKKLQFSLPSSLGIANLKPSEKKAPAFTFGKENSLKETTKTPEFSFGNTKSEDASKLETPQQTPQPFTFGKKTESEAKPAFSFEKQPSTDGPKPAFSFGKSDSKDAPNPAFSFGGSSSINADSKPSTDSKLMLTGSTDSPAFGAPKESFTLSSLKSATPPVSKPKETSSTAESTKPAFSFGVPSQTSQNSTTFSFANSAPSQSAPASKETTPFSFQKAASEKPSTAPAFTFGKTDSSAATGSTFGASGASKPFSFGGSANPSTTSASASGGNDNDTKSKPFSFGNTPKFNAPEAATSTSTPPSGFTFGSSKPVDLKPSFNFGSNSNNGSTDSTLGKTNTPNPSISFGTASAKVNPQGGNGPEREASSSPFGNVSQTQNNTSAFGNGTGAFNSKPAFNLGTKTPASGAPNSAFSFGGSTNSGATASPFTGAAEIAPRPAAPLNKFLLGFNASPATVGSPAFGSTGSTSLPLQSAPGVNGGFGFTNVQTPKPVIGGAFGPSGTFTSPFGASGLQQFGGVNASGGSNPPLRSVTPGFNFGQQNVVQNPANGVNGANGPNAFQPQMNPSILFSQTNLDPLQIFSAATPPPMGTGTPPLHRHGRQFAQARLRRR